MAACDATYKLSIKFTDFYDKGESFHYPFGNPYIAGNAAGLNEWWFKKIKTEGNKRIQLFNSMLLSLVYG